MNQETLIMTTEPQTTNYLIMQNKPNFLNIQMNVSPVMTKHYEQKTPLRQSENKPKTNPKQTQFH